MTNRMANILLSGRCNLRCPACIGRQPGRALPDNLERFPLAGMARFEARLRRLGVREITLTGTNTDPLLHARLGEVVRRLKARVPGARLNLHTNGVLAMRRLDVIRRCHRMCLSLPSLTAATCEAMTGSARVLDLERIVAEAGVPVKVSVLLSPHNMAEIPSLLARCRGAGVRRVVLRQPWPRPAVPLTVNLGDAVSRRRFAGNPVYQLDGLEVTVWDFGQTRLHCLNLFSDGSMSHAYLLHQA